MIRALLFSLSLTLSVLAYTVTSPTNNTKVTADTFLTITWTRIDTDASKFDIALVNEAIYPAVSELLAGNVDGTTGSLTVQIPNVSGSGFQIYLENVIGQLDSGNLAKSQEFTITTGSSSFVSSTSSSSSSTTSASGSTSSVPASSSGFSASESSSSTSGSTSSSALTSPSNNAAINLSAQNGLLAIAISLLIGALMA